MVSLTTGVLAPGWHSGPASFGQSHYWSICTRLALWTNVIWSVSLLEYLHQTGTLDQRHLVSLTTGVLAPGWHSGPASFGQSHYWSICTRLALWTNVIWSVSLLEYLHQAGTLDQRHLVSLATGVLAPDWHSGPTSSGQSRYWSTCTRLALWTNVIWSVSLLEYLHQTGTLDQRHLVSLATGVLAPDWHSGPTSSGQSRYWSTCTRLALWTNVIWSVSLLEYLH